MTTILQEAAAGSTTVLSWTTERYRSAVAAGVIPEDTAFELLDGLIVRKNRAAAGEDPMTIGDRHRIAVLRLAQAASRFETHGCLLQTQQPIRLPPLSEPEPDAAVVRGGIDDYLDHPPLAADVSSVIEVSDSSLSLDLGPKLQAYASAGIPQYVVVDLVNNRVLVHEEPAAGAYGRVAALGRGTTVAIRARDARVSLAVDPLLP
jgi:hypothetical protein